MRAPDAREVLNKGQILLFLASHGSGNPVSPTIINGNLSIQLVKSKIWALVLTPLLLPPIHAESPQSCPALCDPMDCSSPGSSVHGILQARIHSPIKYPAGTYISSHPPVPTPCSRSAPHQKMSCFHFCPPLS